MNKPPSLRSRRDFQRVLRAGRRCDGVAGTLVTHRGADPAAPARLGLAVPATVGGAVVRNRIKRRLRAAFVAAEPPAGLDVVARATASAASADFQELEKHMRRTVKG